MSKSVSRAAPSLMSRVRAAARAISARMPPERYVITTSGKGNLVTVQTASGVHVATIPRSTAIRDGLIEPTRSTKVKRRR
jgi:hypothetical protein